MLHDQLITAILYLLLDRKHREQHHFLYVQYPSTNHSKVSFNQVPPLPINHTRIVVVGDTHGRHHGLSPFPPCDLFVHCGDVLMLNRLMSSRAAIKQLMHFNRWLGTIPAKERIVVGGNHDEQLASLGLEKSQQLLTNCTYLENSSMQHGIWSIWGTPLSTGKSPNRAFQSKEFHTETFEKCPNEVDILISHGPLPELERKIKHKLHLCGHSHNSYGLKHKLSDDGESKILSVCAPIHDGHFRMRHLPVIIDIPNNISDNTNTSFIPQSPCVEQASEYSVPKQPYRILSGISEWSSHFPFKWLKRKEARIYPTDPG